jgi:hypothetical protein
MQGTAKCGVDAITKSNLWIRAETSEDGRLWPNQVRMNEIKTYRTPRLRLGDAGFRACAFGRKKRGIRRSACLSSWSCIG